MISRRLVLDRSLLDPVEGDTPALGKAQKEESISMTILNKALETGVRFHGRDGEQSEEKHSP